MTEATMFLAPAVDTVSFSVPRMEKKKPSPEAIVLVLE